MNVASDLSPSSNSDSECRLVPVLDGMAGYNWRPEWQLTGVETAYFRNRKMTKGKATLEPKTGGDWPIAPGEIVALSLLGAGHRCDAIITVEALDSQGTTLISLNQSIDPRRKGGQRASGYDRVTFNFISPPGSASLRCVIEQTPRATATTDSFVFVAIVSFQRQSALTTDVAWAVHEDRIFVCTTLKSSSDFIFQIDKREHIIAAKDGADWRFADLSIREEADGRTHLLTLSKDDEELWVDWSVLPTPKSGGIWAKQLGRQKAKIADLEQRLKQTTAIAPTQLQWTRLNRFIANNIQNFADAITEAGTVAQRLRGVSGAAVGPIRTPVVPTSSGSEPYIPKCDAALLPVVNWVIGPPDNAGWAYGNNAKRLAAHLRSWSHLISSDQASDIVLYFDALVAERFPAQGKTSVLRVGGDRPIDRLFGSDVEKLRKGIAQFEAVITLSPALQRRLAAAHPNVWFIPNGLDLQEWAPTALRRQADRSFTVGFAASIKSPSEREVKGLDFVEAACSTLNIPLVRAHKGRGQVAHHQMVEDFYSKIDVLVHPAAPGREGTSNVIMEAMALGIPVILTRHAGFHGEVVKDGIEGLIVNRDVAEIVSAISRLRFNKLLRRRIAEGSRRFAVLNHDIRKISEQYDEVLRTSRERSLRASLKVTQFVPFWQPVENFASSRLRARMPDELLQQVPAVIHSPGHNSCPDVAVVIQSADDPTISKLRSEPNLNIVYDICDRYFENPRDFKTAHGIVNSMTRFAELAEIADAIVAPTLRLKGELARRLPDKAVYYIPELRDFDGADRDVTPANKTAVWFGSSQRGNFSSAEPLLLGLHKKFGYAISVLTKKGSVPSSSAIYPFVTEWTAEKQKAALENAAICVVSHSAEEFTKSPNRLVTAVTAGVPTIVSQSPACEDILREAGCEFAIVRDASELASVLRRLEEPDAREEYIRRVQAVIERHHGRAAVRAAYDRLIYTRLPKKNTGRSPRVAFVTHNLNIGEGAPTSLYELADGLKRLGAVQPFVYCASGGGLADSYDASGVPITIFDAGSTNGSRVLNLRTANVRRHFKRFLVENQIDVVVANTIKCAPFVSFAAAVNVPALLIIRESFAAHNRFDYYSAELADTAAHGLQVAQSVVFVSKHTATLWRDQPMTTDIRVVHNGVSPARFATTFELSRQEARSRVGVRRKFVALAVGTIGKRKGQRELIDWYSKLPKSTRYQLQLSLVGAVDAKFSKELQETLDNLDPSIREGITVSPETRDIGLHYRAADIFLINSAQESYPRSVMEALLFGLPVVTTPVFGTREQITENVNGLFYNHGDRQAWSNAIRLLLADEAYRRTMQDNAASSFWMATTYQEMLNDYRGLIHAAWPPTFDPSRPIQSRPTPPGNSNSSRAIKPSPPPTPC